MQTIYKLIDYENKETKLIKEQAKQFSKEINFTLEEI